MDIKGMAKRVVAKKRLIEKSRLEKKRKAEIKNRASNFIDDFNNELFGNYKRPNIGNFLKKHAEEISGCKVFKASLRLGCDMTDFLKFDYSGRGYWGDRMEMCGKEQHQLITKYLSKLNKIFDTSVYFTFGTDCRRKGTYYGEGRSSSSVYYYPTVYLNIPLK